MQWFSNAEIWKRGRIYLLQFDGVTERVLANELVFQNERPKEKRELYRRMLEHAKNRQQMPNVIGDIEALRECLFDFNSDNVLSTYANDWKALFNKIKQEVKTPGEVRGEEGKGLWPTYCRSALSIAQFLNKFETMEAFDTFVDEFVEGTPAARIALPLLLKEEIHGYGFALACDFLKENISPLFAKPDTHINFIFKGAGLSAETASDYQVFLDVIRFANSVQQTPFAVDRLYWMIGSGKIYRAGLKVSSDRESFVRSLCV